MTHPINYIESVRKQVFNAIKCIDKAMYVLTNSSRTYNLAKSVHSSCDHFDTEHSNHFSSTGYQQTTIGMSHDHV